MDFNAFIPFEFGYISEPLLIRLRGVELAIKEVFGKILRIFCLPCTAVVVVLDGRFYILYPTDTKDSLVIDVDIVIVSQIIVDTAVAFVGAFHMNLLDFLSKSLVLGDPMTSVSRRPFMIGGTSHMKQLTGSFYGIFRFRIAFFYGCVEMALPYL